MEDEPGTVDLRCNLVEYLEPLTADRVLVIGETSGVTAGPFYAGGEATPDWVADKHEHDRYAAGFMQQNFSYLIATAYDHVRGHADQFSCERPRSFRTPASQAIVDLDVMALDPA